MCACCLPLLLGLLVYRNDKMVSKPKQNNNIISVLTYFGNLSLY